MMRAALAALMLGVAGAAAAASWPSAGTDPRFELLGVIQMLAGSDRAGAGVFRHDIPYVHLAEARFRRYVFHPVVERYAELTRGGLDYLSAYHFIYALGEPPELALREELPERLLERLGGRQGAEELRLLLSDFARTSRFEAFYRDTAAQRQAMTVSVEAQAAALDPRGRLTAYTGLPVEGRFALILSPFAEPSLAAAFLRAGEPRLPWRLDCVYGPEAFEGRVEYRLETRLGSIWSEVLQAQLKAAAGGPQAQRQIAFAAEARVLDLAGYHEAAAEWPVKYGRIGIPHLQPLMDSLRVFEAQRGRYPTLLDFYPRLLETLAAQAPQPGPFLGGVAHVLASGVDTVLLPSLTPSGLRARAAELFPKAQMLSDEAALKTDLKGKTLAVLGAPSGNAWLARQWPLLHLPMTFSEGGVTLVPRGGDERRYEFRGRLGLISAALNPEDAAHGLILYAAEPQDLSALLGAYGGPADFAIMAGTAAVKTGLYEKSRIPWRVK